MYVHRSSPKICKAGRVIPQKTYSFNFNYSLFSCSRWKTHALSLPPSLLIPASAFVCIFLRALVCISSKLVNYGLVSWTLNVIDQIFSMGRQGKGDPLVQTGRSSLDTQWILGSSGRLCA
ncbi:hypothetical protein ILYODFUR_026026 [Ilyodon furcidens]|uniref:Uncharacterized protein n=1 Tax=Ilyodon furcidens TaxID=33524 RepID=A0ABV0SPB9_9TELE